MTAPPVTPALVAVDAAPIRDVLHCACAGLRALGQHTHAEALEWAQMRAHLRRADVTPMRRVLADAIIATEACLALANEMGAEQWPSVAHECVRHLRALERRIK